MSSLRRSRAALSLLAAPTLIAATAVSSAAALDTTGHTTDRAAAVRLDARLRPTGDPDGTGHATVRLNRAAGRVCAEITWSRIGSVTRGASCADGVGKRLIRRIAQYPQRYYVNVHNAAYPAGAIQGTLR